MPSRVSAIFGLIYPGAVLPNDLEVHFQSLQKPTLHSPSEL